MGNNIHMFLGGFFTLVGIGLIVMYYKYQEPIRKENFKHSDGRFNMVKYRVEKAKLPLIFFIVFAGIYNVIRSL